MTMVTSAMPASVCHIDERPDHVRPDVRRQGNPVHACGGCGRPRIGVLGNMRKVIVLFGAAGFVLCGCSAADTSSAGEAARRWHSPRSPWLRSLARRRRRPTPGGTARTGTSARGTRPTGTVRWRGSRRGRRIFGTSTSTITCGRCGTGSGWSGALSPTSTSRTFRVTPGQSATGGATPPSTASRMSSARSAAELADLLR